MSKEWRIAIAAAFAAWVGLTAYDVYRAGDVEERDITREWVVARYVLAGTDPYGLAKDVLIAEYGVANPKGRWISRIPATAPEGRRADVIPAYGVPEATYPPGAIAFLALTLGVVDDAGAALSAWFVLDVLLVLVLACLLARLWPTPPVPPGPGGNFWWILLVAILFTPVYTTLERAQFSLLVMSLMLVVDDPGFAWPVRGVALGLALMKPSVCLPLCLLPLVRGQWRVIATGALVQVAGSAYVAFKIGRDPIGIYRDWLAVSRYFLSAGMYTVQEWVLPMSARFPLLVPAVPLALLTLCLVTLFLHRQASRARLFSLAGVTAVFWTYHGTYDAVFLLPMLLRRMGWSEGTVPKPLSGAGVVLFAALCLAYMEAVFASVSPAWHAYRWAVRFGMIALFVLEYVELYRDARHVGRIEPATDPDLAGLPVA